MDPTAVKDEKMRPPVFYVPWTPSIPGWSIDKASLQGAAWLAKRAGNKLMLVSSTQNYQQNAMASHTRGAVVAKPVSLWKTKWRVGPVLAPWPTEEILGELASGLHRKATTICVIEWGDDAFQTAWLQAHRARSVLDGEVYPGADLPLLDPVVEAAMTELTQLVNHGNALGNPYEKPQTVELLQLLLQAGYGWDVDRLCGWALANDFTGAEVRNLRDYATKVSQGHRFRNRHTHRYAAGAVARWEAAAKGGTTA